MPIPANWQAVSDAEVTAALEAAERAPLPEGCKERLIWLGGVIAFGHFDKCFLRPGDRLINVLHVM